MKKLAALFCLLAPAIAVSAQDVPKFTKRGDMEKKFVSDVCVAIIKAAHPTGVEPKLEKYEYKEVKAGQTQLIMKGSYKGKVTRKVYNADITVLIDTSNKDSWEVLRIDYSDNNNVPASRTKLDEIRKKFNEK